MILEQLRSRRGMPAARLAREVGEILGRELPANTMRAYLGGRALPRARDDGVSSEEDGTLKEGAMRRWAAVLGLAVWLVAAVPAQAAPPFCAFGVRSPVVPGAVAFLNIGPTAAAGCQAGLTSSSYARLGLVPFSLPASPTGVVGVCGFFMGDAGDMLIVVMDMQAMEQLFWRNYTTGACGMLAGQGGRIFQL